MPTIESASKILTVVGARPQFIKAAATSRAFAARGLNEVLVHTGQHYDHRMSEVFFQEMELLAPAHNLHVGSASHGVQTARMLEGLEAVLVEEAPDAVVVFGDTNSTLAAVLAAVKLHIPVGHVEAGMRSYQRRMPEEINRVVTDHLASWHWCVTEGARENLAREGVREGVRVVGDVMADVLIEAAQKVGVDRNPAAALGLGAGEYLVMTCHRAENTDDPARLRAIFEAAGTIGAQQPVVYPIHPRTRACLQAQGLVAPEGLHLIEAASYLEMVALVRDASCVLTDSGGLQKEAYMLGIPCVTLRAETEWTGTVASGWNTLADADPARIVAAASAALSGQAPTASPRLFGDGQSAGRIADHLAEQLGAGDGLG